MSYEWALALLSEASDSLASSAMVDAMSTRIMRGLTSTMSSQTCSSHVSTASEFWQGRAKIV